MGKIKDVLNSINKDEKNISRTGSKGTIDTKTPRRPSKASSKETVESVVTPVVVSSEPIQENSRKLSIKTDIPVEVVDRELGLLLIPCIHSLIQSSETCPLNPGRYSTAEPLSAKIVADTESQKVAARK
jgi:hypothetical protein